MVSCGVMRWDEWWIIFTVVDGVHHISFFYRRIVTTAAATTIIPRSSLTPRISTNNVIIQPAYSSTSIPSRPSRQNRTESFQSQVFPTVHSY